MHAKEYAAYIILLPDLTTFASDKKTHKTRIIITFLTRTRLYLLKIWPFPWTAVLLCPRVRHFLSVAFPTFKQHAVITINLLLDPGTTIINSRRRRVARYFIFMIITTSTCPRKRSKHLSRVINSYDAIARLLLSFDNICATYIYYVRASLDNQSIFSDCICTVSLSWSFSSCIVFSLKHAIITISITNTMYKRNRE